MAPKKSELNMERVPIDDLLHAEYNPRVLEQGSRVLKKLKASIEEFGYVVPVVWNKRTRCIVSGHKRVLTLKESGATEVDVVAVDLDETDERSLNLAMNKIRGEWDFVKLSDLLEDLKLDGDDLSVTGFEKEELDAFTMPTDDEPTEEDIQDGLWDNFTVKVKIPENDTVKKDAVVQYLRKNKIGFTIDGQADGEKGEEEVW